jgi:hypothetical protein
MSRLAILFMKIKKQKQLNLLILVKKKSNNKKYADRQNLNSKIKKLSP